VKITTVNSESDFNRVNLLSNYSSAVCTVIVVRSRVERSHMFETPTPLLFPVLDSSSDAEIFWIINSDSC